MAKIIKCKAAVAWEVNKPFTIEEIEVAPPKEGEVRIKVVASGFCHSDLSAISYEMFHVKFPCILGHEGSGIVESVGEKVTQVKPGDHVLITFMETCNKCHYCQHPKTNQCVNQSLSTNVLSDGTSRFTCKGQVVFHIAGTSCFTEYTVLKESAVIKINKSVNLEKVCLLSCGVTTGYGAAINTAKVTPGSSCAIWGLGCIGLAAIMGCKTAGATRIIGVDINPSKFEKAKEFGCTDCLNPNDFDKPIQQILREMTVTGLDFTFECVGIPQTMVAAFESCSNGWGVCTIVGVVQNNVLLSINPLLLLFGRTIKGSLLGDFRPQRDFPKLIEDYQNKRIKVDEFISHNLPLDEINTAMAMMKSGESIRTVLKIS